MRRISLTVALVMLATLPAGCGSDDDDSGAEAGAGGADGSVTGAGGRAGAQEYREPPCPSVTDPSICDWWELEPGEVQYAPCELSLSAEEVSYPEALHLLIDCIEVSANAEGGAPGWSYDPGRSVLVIEEPECDSILVGQVTRIDVYQQCPTGGQG